MSRIIVKNLPIKATENDVRQHFDKNGHITDVRVMRKKDGSSRRFAFVGFSNDREAEDAAKYFNLSFMSSSRLDVSLAKALGDESLDKRKQALKRKRLEQREELEGSHNEVNSKSQKKQEPKDSKLDEFLSVMQPQRATAMWKNDSTDKSAAKGQHAVADEDEDVNDLSNMNDQNDDTEGNEAVQANESSNAGSDEEPEWDPAANLNEEEENGKQSNPEMSDLDWLRQRQTRIMENGEKPQPVVQEKEPAPTEEAEDVNTFKGPTNRLFLRNLAYTTSQGDLISMFTKFGPLKQVHIPIDPKTDKPKGIAFVEFEEVSDAENAQQELDGKSFQGRLLHIIYAQEQRGYVLDEFDIKNMPLKKQKALKRRMQASKQQFSWNSLYMRPDTVLEAAAAKLGMSKSEMMDPASSNMAVQQALAESSVLESIQSYFRSKNVDLARFSSGTSQLSDTVILAKNLPYTTSAQEIQDNFAQFGEVTRTLMPPDGGIAIVQFKLASAGRQAFKKLAFRRVGDSILYLQKAPKGVLEEQSSGDIKTETEPAKPDTKTVKSSVQDILLPQSAAQDEDLDEVRTSVFVKNLNFATTESSLSKLFQSIPGFIAATIKTKPDSQHPGQKLSMGFGFVEFRTKGQAEVAIKSLQNHVLDNHALELKISSRGSDKPSGKSAKGAVTSKIVIKNIPFETTKQDVVDLFGTFGKLRSVRVPRKFNRQTRGFAFAEFATPKEAEHAMSSLSGAHLLGRRLVMDYAQADAEDPETEIARMEAKVAKQVSAQELHEHKLGGQQKNFDMDDEE